MPTGPFHLDVQHSRSETGLQIVKVSWIAFLSITVYLFFHWGSKSLMLLSPSPHLISYQPCKLFLSSFDQTCPFISFSLAMFLIQVLITSIQINEKAFHVCFLPPGGRWHITSWSILLNGQFNHILFFSPIRIIFGICGILKNPQSAFTFINLFDLHTKPVRWAEQVWTFLSCSWGS